MGSGAAGADSGSAEPAAGTAKTVPAATCRAGTVPTSAGSAAWPWPVRATWTQMPRKATTLPAVTASRVAGKRMPLRRFLVVIVIPVVVIVDVVVIIVIVVAVVVVIVVVPAATVVVIVIAVIAAATAIIVTVEVMIIVVIAATDAIIVAAAVIVVVAAAMRSVLGVVAAAVVVPVVIATAVIRRGVRIGGGTGEGSGRWRGSAGNLGLEAAPIAALRAQHLLRLRRRVIGPIRPGQHALVGGGPADGGGGEGGGGDGGAQRGETVHGVLQRMCWQAHRWQGPKRVGGG